MELCCGALINMGESVEQRIELLTQLQELEPTEVPINFLNPRPGTPLGDREVLGAWDAVRWIALFRLALPSVILRYAGGREVTLRDLQAMGMTAGINALIVGNYLTTLGARPRRTCGCSRIFECRSALCQLRFSSSGGRGRSSPRSLHGLRPTGLRVCGVCAQARSPAFLP